MKCLPDSYSTEHGSVASLAGNTNDSGALDLSSLLGQLESIIGNVTATLGNIPPLSTVPLPTGTSTTATPDITTIINTFVSLLTVSSTFLWMSVKERSFNLFNTGIEHHQHLGQSPPL